MKKYIFFVAGVLALSSMMVSCKDTLTEKPDSFYEKDTYFTSPARAEMAVLGIYSSISHRDHYGSCNMAFMADDDQYFIQGTSRTVQRDVAHYMADASNVWIRNIWQYNYQGIDRANLAIDGIMKMDGYEQSDALKQLVAEARFLRAFQAFDLVKYWGDVPFKTEYSTTYSSAFGARVDRELIYDQIVEDLNYAKEVLPWATSTSSPERATQGAARALLMRVLLQRAGYSLHMDGQLERPDDTKRREYFEQVVKEWEAFQQGSHDFYTGGYEALFKSFSQLELNTQESIFEIAFQYEAGKLNSGWWGSYNGPEVAEATGAGNTNYMGRANAFFRALPDWYKFYEDNDARRDVNIVRYRYTWNKDTQQQVKSSTENDQGKWYPGKWRREWMALGFKDPNYTDVNYSVLRYADVVLMAAEAYNELGNTSEAWNLINEVRERAGASHVDATTYASVYKAPKVYDLVVPTDATNGATPGKIIIDDSDEQGKVRTALYWERGFELCFEGQRKYDLIRWGCLYETLTLFGMKSTKLNPADPNKTKQYAAYINFTTGKNELYPIPLTEIQSNPMLESKNNPGYN